MSARKLRESWWVDFRACGRRYRRRSPLNTRAGALEYEAMLRRKLANGEAAVVGSQGPVPATFGDAARQWFSTYVKTNTRLSVQRSYEMMLRVHLIPYFKRRALGSVTSYDVEQYKATKLQAGLSKQSVNHHLALLRCFLRMARQWSWIRRVPSIKLLRTPPHQFDFFTPEQSMRLLAGARRAGWYDMILCALRTGMRAGELRGLRWADVVQKRGMIDVRRSIVCGQESSPKNNRARHVPMTEDLGLALRERSRVGRLVFANDDGGPLTPSAMRRGLEKSCRDAGLRTVGWHALRHTFASQLAAAGASLPAIQTLMGHSTIQMTMRYSHLTASTLRDTVGLLASAAAGERQPLGQPVGNKSPRPRSVVLPDVRDFAKVSGIRRDAPNGKAAVC